MEDFFSLPTVIKSTASGLKDVTNEEFSRAGIPSLNMIGFASDNTNSMLGRSGGLAALLRQERPHLIVFGCVCHSFTLCAAAACDKLPEDIVHFANSMYNYVASSPKRQLKLKKCQDFARFAKLLSCRTCYSVSKQNYMASYGERSEAFIGAMGCFAAFLYK